MAREPHSNPRNRPQTTTAAMRRPSVVGSALMLPPAILFGASNLPAVIALAAICAIWIWYEAGQRA